MTRKTAPQQPITLYTNPMSRGRVVRWMLEEVAVEYEMVIKHFGNDIKSADYLDINPMGKVPALVHGDVVVTETAAICAYLADQFPEKNLAPPPNSLQRGSYYRWLFFTAAPFEMATSAIIYDWQIDDTMASVLGCGKVTDVLNVLEQALNRQEYVCGNQFTAADLLLSSMLGWEISQKHVQPLPVFMQYVKRCQNREAHQRSDEMDNALAAELSAA